MKRDFEKTNLHFYLFLFNESPNISFRCWIEFTFHVLSTFNFDFPRFSNLCQCFYFTPVYSSCSTTYLTYSSHIIRDRPFLCSVFRNFLSYSIIRHLFHYYFFCRCYFQFFHYYCVSYPTSSTNSLSISSLWH